MLVKIIAFILSFYVLGLNFLACNDSASSLNPDAEVSVVNFQDMDPDHSHDQTADLCPPFCSCHCCHVHTVKFDSAEFQPLIVDISSELFLHFDSLGKEIPHSILQPPRV